MFVAMTGHIYLYGEVGDAITADKFRKEIDPQAADYTIHVSSVGGDVFEGYTIYNLIKNLKATTGKKVYAQVEGLCASIMTLIVGACDEVIMNKTTQFMIHNPQIGNLSGDATELRNVADQLDKIKGLLIDVYVTRTGMSKEELWAMYEKETWLTADEAVSMGFADRVEDAIKAVAKVDVQKFKSDKMEKTVLDKLQASFKNIFGLLRKVTNVVDMTLADNTPVIVMAEPGEDLVGKPITNADGTPLPAGEYTLASGDVLRVDDSGVITEVVPKAADNPAPEDMEKVKQLENEVATLKAQLAEKATNEADLKAQTNELKNKFTALAKELGELRKQPAGDPNPPVNGRHPKTTNSAEDFDPMGEDIITVLQSRNLYK
jgi:ATP-dependent protease ClpP protease subunit